MVSDQNNPHNCEYLAPLSWQRMDLSGKFGSLFKSIFVSNTTGIYISRPPRKHQILTRLQIKIGPASKTVGWHSPVIVLSSRISHNGSAGCDTGRQKTLGIVIKGWMPLRFSQPNIEARKAFLVNGNSDCDPCGFSEVLERNVRRGSPWMQVYVVRYNDLKHDCDDSDQNTWL